MIRPALLLTRPGPLLLRPALLLVLALPIYLGAACSGSPTPGAGPDVGLPDARPGDGRPRDGAKDVPMTPDRTAPSEASVDGGTVPLCIEASGSGKALAGDIADTRGKAAVTLAAGGAPCELRYDLSSTASRRDDFPKSPRRVAEVAGKPVVRTRNRMFDALYALALAEIAEDSVPSIHDVSFNGGKPISCPSGGCFETGRKWTYAWTRDTAYAVALGLAPLDPTRSRNTLQFKTSELRSGGGRQIVQDTGTGGSYPTSSDRVVWALGAWEVLKYLDGLERELFRDLTFETLSNTVEHDRLVVYDAADGLYRGEQSFLDWREQSYPAWVRDDPVHIGMSKALSTSIGHLRALEVAAALAKEKSDTAAAQKYQGWADTLRSALRQRFWIADLGLYSTFVTTYLDAAPVRHFDLLSSALAVLSGVATPLQASSILAKYPHLPFGPPVLWPQQQDVPIYHNRAIWPFVTAFWARAAKQMANDQAIDLAVDSLVSAAALNLSNMENLELETGKPWLLDGPMSGPIVNSQRQLWSVAAYVSLVHDIVFGLEATQTGIRFLPYITRKMRHGLFAAADSLVLNNFPYKGKRITVVVKLPAKTKGGGKLFGAYAIDGLTLGGKKIDPTAEITAAQLGPRNLIEVTLAASWDAGKTITLTTKTGAKQLFAPKPPKIAALVLTGGKLELSIDRNGEKDKEIAINIYRDGKRVASALSGAQTAWTDPGSSANSRSHCYVVESVYLGSGNHSQHSSPFCYWGLGGQRVASVLATAFQNTGGSGSSNYGRFHYENWGDPGDQLGVSSFTAAYTGTHLFQVVYGNGSGAVSTGITCAVKRIEVAETGGGATVGGGYLVMPQLGKWSIWRDSSFVPITLKKGKSYRIVIKGDAHAINMSSFAHFSIYTGGTGGTQGAFNRVNISELKILSTTAN